MGEEEAADGRRSENNYEKNSALSDDGKSAHTLHLVIHVAHFVTSGDDRRLTGTSGDAGDQQEEVSTEPLCEEENNKVAGHS